METSLAEVSRLPAHAPFVGRQFFPGYQLPICVGDYATALATAPAGSFGLVHIAQGTGLIEGPDGPMLVAAPAIILIDDRSRPELVRSGSLRLRAIFFAPSLINGLFNADRLQDGTRFDGTAAQDAYLLQRFVDPTVIGRPLLVPPALHERIEETFARIAAEGASQSDDNWPCRTRSWLIELLFRLRIDAPPPQFAITQLNPECGLDRSLLLVHEHFNTAFTLDDLARWCGSNRTQLNIHFRRLTGQSVRQYVIGLRMRVASALLRETGLPIAEIMGRVGYDDPSNFTRTFRAALGQTPSQHRRGPSPA